MNFPKFLRRKVSVTVLCGDGFNCEFELKRAFEMAGGYVDLVHTSDFLKNPKLLLEAQIFALPGGFSFGDELRSGKILAEKIRQDLMELLPKFLKRQGLVLGICNGFQVLCQLGVFGSGENTLATNEHGEFRDLWVECEVTEQGKKSPWLKEVRTRDVLLPIRHKEGNLRLAKSVNEASFLEQHAALVYKQNVNGSVGNVAGLVDASGQIFGLMPHPEAALESFLYPESKGSQENAEQLKKIFESAVKY